MQLFVLMLVVGLMVHDSGSGHATLASLTAHPFGAAMLWRLAWPKFLTLFLYALFCQYARRQIGTHRSAKALRRTEKAGIALRIAALTLYHDDLFRLGLLESIRATIGDRIVLDELLVMLPPIAMIVIGWWLYYPIEKKLRQRIALDRSAVGLPTQRIWTCSQYLLERFRMQIASILLPLLLMIAWSELVNRWFAPPLPGKLPGALPGAGASANTAEIRSILTLLGAGAVLLFSPWLLRLIWNTVPLPAGEVRDDLMKLCQTHRVGVRELLEWKTFGGMVNAAVMGLVKPLRFILLSDGLLESLTPGQIQAVMAHEVAHVKKHHMFWLLISAMATLGLGEILWTNCVESIVWYLEHINQAPAWLMSQDHQDMLSAVLSIVTWIFIFGWISRRYERQADTFAVQHLARERAIVTPQSDWQILIDQESATIMIQALEQVAVLNCVDPRRRSWRHGSIFWRQQYLQSLVGRPVRRTSIDRVAWQINIAAALVMLLLVLLSVWGFA